MCTIPEFDELADAELRVQKALEELDKIEWELENTRRLQDFFTLSECRIKLQSLQLSKQMYQDYVVEKSFELMKLTIALHGLSENDSVCNLSDRRLRRIWEEWLNESKTLFSERNIFSKEWTTHCLI